MSTKTTFEWIVLTVLGSALLKLSIPPASLGVVALAAWAPALVILFRFSITRTVLSGLVMGSFWVSDLPVALIEWTWTLPTIAFILGAIYCASFLFIVSILMKERKIECICLIFPSVFVVFSYAGQTVFPTPIALSPLLIDAWPEFFVLGKYVGFYGLEFLVALINSVAALVIVKFLTPTQPTTRDSRKSTQNIHRFLETQKLYKFGIVPVVCISCLMCGYIYTTQHKTTDGNNLEKSELPTSISIYALQPAIHHRDAIQAGNSLFDRRKIETTFDSLTKQALQFDEPGLIIWPEGGHNRPNLSLQRRRDKMLELIYNKKSELLFAGYEVDSKGNKLNTVSLLNKNGFRKTVVKSKLAPIAESYLTSGIPEIIQSKFATLGIIICFEAIFTQHYRDLKEQNAQAFIVVTDDSSFGKTFLYQRHLSYARVNAAIYQTPLVFINNHGPSFLIDENGRIAEKDLYGDQAHINSWKLQISRNQTPIPIQLHDGVVIVSFFSIILLLLSSLVGPKTTHTTHTEHKKQIYFFKESVIAFGLLSLSIPVDLTMLANKRDSRITDLLAETHQRYSGESSLDAIAPIYQQREKASCGAAAMAYALTRMGDELLEFEILLSQPAKNPRGYNLGELKSIAEQRGFNANAYRASIKELPKPGGTPAVAHWQDDHFVVVLQRSDTEVVYFDPGHGRVFHLSHEEFSSRWSGALLQLSYDDRWLTESLNFYAHTEPSRLVSSRD